MVVTYETIRCWCDKFGAHFAHRVKAERCKPGSTWHLDGMLVTLRGEPYLLWHADVPELANVRHVLASTIEPRTAISQLEDTSDACVGFATANVRRLSCRASVRFGNTSR